MGKEGASLDGKQGLVELDFVKGKDIYEAYTHRNNVRLKAGEFTVNQKKDLIKAKNLGLIDNKPFDARLVNKPNQISLKLDPSSVEYNAFETSVVEETKPFERLEENRLTNKLLQSQKERGAIVKWSGKRMGSA